MEIDVEKTPTKVGSWSGALIAGSEYTSTLDSEKMKTICLQNPAAVGRLVQESAHPVGDIAGVTTSIRRRLTLARAKKQRNLVKSLGGPPPKRRKDHYTRWPQTIVGIKYAKMILIHQAVWRDAFPMKLSI
jgi:hypothetical protein